MNIDERPDNEVLLRPSEAMKYAGVGRTTWMKFLQCKLIRPVTVGCINHKRYRLSDVKALIKECQ
jgi:hypothetical protein